MQPLRHTSGVVVNGRLTAWAFVQGRKKLPQISPWAFLTPPQNGSPSTLTRPRLPGMRFSRTGGARKKSGYRTFNNFTGTTTILLLGEPGIARLKAAVTRPFGMALSGCGLTRAASTRQAVPNSLKLSTLCFDGIESRQYATHTW
jgi:hypothetical protein